WFPTLLEELAKPARGFEHRSRPTIRIARANNPPVAMVTHYYPAILFLESVNPGNNVPDGADLVVHVGLEMDLDVVCASDVISEGQSSLESAWSYWTFQGRDELPRNIVGDWLHRNLGEIGYFLRFQARYTGNRRFAGS